MRAHVDKDVCTACGLCADSCPAVFSLGDDDEVAKVIVDAVPADMEDCARQAAEDCPVEAISIED